MLGMAEGIDSRLQERCLVFDRVVKNMNLGVGHTWPACAIGVYGFEQAILVFQLVSLSLSRVW